MANTPSRALLSSGKKIIMAVTGLALCIYLVLHLAGNLTLLLGTRTFNNYASLLGGLPFLIIVELGLLAIFLIHAYEAVQVTLDNNRARPESYQQPSWTHSERSHKSFSSTTMMVTGSIVLIFVALHVWHFKYDHPVGGVAVGVTSTSVTVPPGAGARASEQAVRDLAGLVEGEFHKPLIVALYLVSMLALGLHLWHAVSSSFQSLGIDHPKLAGAIRVFGKAFTIIIAGGFFALPLWAYFFTRGGP